MQARGVEIAAQRLHQLRPQERVERHRVPALAGGINTNQDASVIADAESPSIVNMIMFQGTLQPDTGYVMLGWGGGPSQFVGTPQAVFQANHSGGNQDTICITTERAYHLSADGTTWIDGGISLSGQLAIPVTAVSYPPFDWIVVTNGFDPPFYFALGHFKQVPFDIAGIVCRSLAVFHESLLLIGTTEEDGIHKRRIRMSDAANPTALLTIEEGAETGIQAIYDLLDTDDDLHCAVALGPWLILYRHSSIMRATYLGLLNQILFWEYMILGEGAQSVNGVCPVTIPFQGGGAYHFVVGNQNLYRYRGDYALEPVGTAIWRDWLSATGRLNQMAKALVWAQYVPNYHEVWVGLPTYESTMPDTILRTMIEGQGVPWFVRRFGDVFLSVGTLLTRFEEDQTVPHMLLAGPVGVVNYDYVANTDLGMPIWWTFETKDIGDAGRLSRFDRLVVMGRGDYDFNVEVSLDRGESWELVDEINFQFATVAWLTFAFVGEYIRFRLSGSDPGFELTWLEVWYLDEGEWSPIARFRPPPPPATVAAPGVFTVGSSTVGGPDLIG